jgi:RNA polymerase sigma-70 factor (ECF subfamily)
MQPIDKVGPNADREGRTGAEALFRTHAAFVVGFLRRLGTPAEELDDQVQEVFLIAHRKGGYVAGAGQPRTWLAAIALRIARNGHGVRSRRREKQGDYDLALIESPARDPAEMLELRKSIERVQRALDTLDIEHRAVFVLREIDGEACDSIAALFNVPIGTVYSRLHYARKRFLEAYGEHVTQPPRLLDDPQVAPELRNDLRAAASAEANYDLNSGWLALRAAIVG